MDCFQDFCLFCERDSPDGPYCSQRCKMADLDTSNPNSPTSTSAALETRWSSTQTSSYRASTYQSSVYASPAHQQRMPSYNPPHMMDSRPRSSYFMFAAPQPDHPGERQLTPSSSRTSLSSATSASATPSAAYHKDTKAQLNDYFSSFDQAKAAKRRSSTR